MISSKSGLLPFSVSANGTIIHAIGHFRCLELNLDTLFSTSYLLCHQVLPILPLQICIKLTIYFFLHDHNTSPKPSFHAHMIAIASQLFSVYPPQTRPLQQDSLHCSQSELLEHRFEHRFDDKSPSCQTIILKIKKYEALSA